jgi:Protein of unknown function (DUF2842)
MRQRTRKLVGALVLVPFVIVYALAAMLLAAGLLPGAPYWAAMLYYAVAGLAWVIPAGLLIRWMQRPDAGYG